MRNSITWSWICHFSSGICGNHSGKNQFFSRSAHAHTDRDTHTNTSAGWLGRPPTLVNTKPDPDLGPRHPSRSSPSSSFVHNSCCPQLCRACTFVFVFVFCIDFLHTHNVAVAKDAQQQKNANALTHTHAHKRTRSACKKLISSLHRPLPPSRPGSRAKDTQQREAIKKVCN